MTLQKQPKVSLDCLLFVLQVSESLQEFQEKGCFSLFKRNLLVREEVESNPGPPSIVKDTGSVVAIRFFRPYPLAILANLYCITTIDKTYLRKHIKNWRGLSGA